MNKFPYIGENNHGVIMLILSRSKGVILSDANKGRTYTIPDSKTNPSTWFERKYKNITAEYLTNTYGKVESKEHAEFIVKLAEANRIRVTGDWIDGALFCFTLDVGGKPFLSFYPERLAKSDGEKLITIPLPPKDKSMESQKEWPQVGDEVLTASNEKAVVKAVDCGLAWVKYDREALGYATEYIEQLKKPLTPKDELDRKLYDFFQCNSEEDLAQAIINGEIEGLEYKPQ